ncbi:MAG: NAD-glutamate dehydrogenase, partial [Nocardioidaceae bacterium]
MHIRQDDERDEAKQELLQQAARLAQSRRSGGAGLSEDVGSLLPVYYRHVALEDIEDRSPTDVYGAAVSQLRLAAERPQGTATVRVFTPTVDEHGWSADGHTVAEIVTDDMPFLVDSVTMSLARSDRSLHLVIHPQLLVQRDVTGRLVHLLRGDAERYDGVEEPADVVRESWMHVEIDRESDKAELDEIESDLVRVLRDVREAIEDWQKMRDKAESIIAELADDPPPLDSEQVTEASELLSWLADDHFTFLGYREYSLQVVDDEDALRAVPGT